MPLLLNPPLTGRLRLEADVRDDDLRGGLEARVADPLWLLGRQWQVGEFRGEDAGSPLRVTVRAQHAPTIVEGAVGVPAEVAVEREPVAAGPGRVGLAVDLGLRLKAALTAVDGAAAWDRLRLKYRLSAMPVEADASLRVRAARSLDALALLTDLNAARELVAAAPPGPRQALARWAEATRDEWTEATAQPTNWQREKLVYDARASNGDRDVLRAERYTGERLDWYSFTYKAPPTAADERVQTAIPAPLSFRGMPASRWWELEDDEARLVDVEGSATDLLETFIAEFATLYGDDWFVVPLRVPYGALARVLELEVTDVFGQSKKLPALARKDGAKRDWQMFELAGEPEPAGPRLEAPGPWLYFPDALLDTQYGAPIEEVRLLRDEASNLGWAVEQVVEGPDGGPRQRSERPPIDDPTGLWAWRAMTAVPRGWIPLMPVFVDAKTREIALQRARLPGWGLDDGVRGAVLGGKPPLLFAEAEIQTTATVVQRLWQRSRHSDGRVLVWLGRRQWAAPAGSGAGLAFDRLKR